MLVDHVLPSASYNKAGKATAVSSEPFNIASLDKRNMPVPLTFHDDPTLALKDRDPNIPAGTSGQVNSLKPSQRQAKQSQDTRSEKSTNTKSSAKQATDKPPSAADLARIHFDGEEDESVPIYDTCNDVRSKIRAHIKKYKGVSLASLSREFSELMPQTKVTANQVGKFLNFKGPRAGAHSPAFYGAYVYFEKLRIYESKGKSKKREEMEELWKKDGGFPR